MEGTDKKKKKEAQKTFQGNQHVDCTPTGVDSTKTRNVQDEKNSSCSKTQTQLASDMGMDVRHPTWQT